MALTFYCGSGSPFAWKVWLALEHKQIPYDLKVLSFQAGDLKTPAFRAVNPRGKVPAIHDAGFSLSESGAICEYLEERYTSGATLLPGNAEERAVARRWAIEADACLYPPVRKLMANTLFKPNGDGDPKEIAEGKEALAAELAYLEAALAQHDHLAGALSVADFAAYPHVALVRRIEDRQPRHELWPIVGPRVRAWVKRIEALPYYAKTYPPHWKA